VGRWGSNHAYSFAKVLIHLGIGVSIGSKTVQNDLIGAKKLR
jgi:hypothetical protein